MSKQFTEKPEIFMFSECSGENRVHLCVLKCHCLCYLRCDVLIYHMSLFLV